MDKTLNLCGRLPSVDLQQRLAKEREFHALCESYQIPPAGDTAGADTGRSITVFLDQGARVRALCYGHTLLNTSLGAAAIITEPVAGLPLKEKLCNMLESLGCTGFVNVSLGLCQGEFVARGADFDLNKSFFQLQAAGLDMCRLSEETYFAEGNDVSAAAKACFWHRVPKHWVYRFSPDRDLANWARELAHQGRCRKGQGPLWQQYSQCKKAYRAAKAPRR